MLVLFFIYSTRRKRQSIRDQIEEVKGRTVALTNLSALRDRIELDDMPLVRTKRFVCSSADITIQTSAKESQRS